MTGAAVVAAGLVALGVLTWPRRAAGADRLTSAPATTRASAGARRPAPVPDVVPVLLLCAALDAGLPPERAVVAVRDALESCGATGAAVDRLPPVARALTLADRTGGSAASVLRRAAHDLVRDRRTASRAAAARLGVRLVLPLGLTVLPSFVLLGVAPVVIGLARQLLG